MLNHTFDKTAKSYYSMYYFFHVTLSKYPSQEGDFVNASTFDIFRTWVTSEIPDMGPEQSLFITTKSKVFENFSAMCFNVREIII